jgi:hypothetical protein
MTHTDQTMGKHKDREALDFESWRTLRDYCNSFTSEVDVAQNEIAGRSFRFDIDYDEGIWSLYCPEWRVRVLTCFSRDMDRNHIIEFVGDLTRLNSDLILMQMHVSSHNKHPYDD